MAQIGLEVLQSHRISRTTFGVLFLVCCKSIFLFDCALICCHIEYILPLTSSQIKKTSLVTSYHHSFLSLSLYTVKQTQLNSSIWKNQLVTNILCVLKLMYCFCAVDFSVFAIVQAVNTWLVSWYATWRQWKGGCFVGRTLVIGRMHAGYYDFHAEKIQAMTYGFLLHYNILFNTYPADIEQINQVNEETVVIQRSSSSKQ